MSDETSFQDGAKMFLKELDTLLDGTNEKLSQENAALKEENKRLRDLLGKTSACISYMNRDVQGVAEEYLGFWPDDIQAEAEALLKEE